MRIYLPFLSVYLPETRLHKQARALVSAGYAVTVFTLWRPGQPEREEIAGYQVRRLRLRSGGWRDRLLSPLVKWIEFSLRLWACCLRRPPDIVQANDAKALPGSWLCAKTARASLVYDARELETGREFASFRLAGIYRRLWALPESLFIRSAAAVITVSEAIAAELARLYSIPRPVVVMNCPESQSLSRTDRLRQELGLPLGRKIALYQGSLSAGRGLEAFVQAVQAVPEVIAVLLGDGPLRAALAQKVQRGEFDRLYLPGRVPMEALPFYIASADIGVALIQDTCLSHRYSLPNKLFEYIQSGLPVVASDLPEIGRIVRSYALGELVDPEDPQAIAAGLHRLATDPAHYAHLQANARIAARELNWEREREKYLALYRQVARRGAA